MELIFKKYVSFILLSLHVWYKMNKIKNVTEISPNLTDFHIYACNNKISVRICNYSKLIKYRLTQKLQDWQYQLFLFRNIRAYIRPTTTDFAELIYNIFRISERAIFFKTKMFFHVYSLHANFEYEPVKFSVNMLIFHCRSFERSIYIWHKFIKHHAENLIKIVWKIGVYAALPFTL